MKTYVEHANIVVSDAESTVQMLLAAAPDWKVRGRGKFEDWFGKEVSWYHVGDDDTYIAIQSGGEGQGSDWKDHSTGVKHIGIAVDSVDELNDRLASAGFKLDHPGEEHPHRKRVYYFDRHGVQFEFVEYFSNNPQERNAYSL